MPRAHQRQYETEDHFGSAGAVNGIAAGRKVRMLEMHRRKERGTRSYDPLSYVWLQALPEGVEP